jgi:hypothetical protein
MVSVESRFEVTRWGLGGLPPNRYIASVGKIVKRGPKKDILGSFLAEMRTSEEHPPQTGGKRGGVPPQIGHASPMP